MSVTTGQLTTIADSIAKTLVDLGTNLVDNAASAMTAVEGGQLGGTNSLNAHIAALTIDNPDSDLPFVSAQVETAVNAFATTGNTRNKFYTMYVPVIEILERETGGIAPFLVTNSLQVHPEFANCVNYAANNFQALGLPEVRLVANAQIFPAASTNLGAIAVTGSAAGTFTVGSAVSEGVGLLTLKNTTGSTSTGTATVIGATYTKADGTSGTTSFTLTGALANNATIAGTVEASAVTAMTVTSGGASSDNFTLLVAPARSVAY